ncbi:undecaprenyl/decaprenyl-phosphate alpha-N-acetylglucosaminyl 1-phosphate transferase [Pelagibacterales bacterium SAG-MED31]|nr:undecaprenyl/decaprenyl-phosphate alpha-N-acetylglucosaminyl 1-phosphate transferase [Pelagibacterales bacterium SAG-MED31]
MYTSSLLILLGVIDDAIELGVFFRLIAQLICCLIVIGSGLTIDHVGEYYYFGKVYLEPLSVIFTVFCVLGLTNSFNFIDGTDGLCAGLAITSLFSILIFSVLLKTNIDFYDFNYLFLITFTLIIFLFFNLTSYFKIFLGDAGSMFLGFLISFILIMVTQDEKEVLNPILTIWCVTLPVFDMISVVLRRLIKKINPFRPDRSHLHHICIEAGFSTFKTTFLILFLSLILNFIGFYSYLFFGTDVALLLFLSLLFIYVYVTYRFSKRIIINQNS